MSDSRALVAAPRIVVTGGALRVGRAIALRLASRGVSLVLTYRTSAAACASTAQDARDAGSASVSTHRLDLTDAHSIDAFAQEALRLGAIDGIVHNASSFQRTPFGEILERDAVEQYKSDALGALLLSQALAASLRDARVRASMPQGAGIVVLGDAHAEAVPRCGYTSYLMAKAAAHALVRQLAVEFAPEVRVNGIAPGVILWPESMPDAARAEYLQRVPLKRSGTPEEAAALAEFLLLDAHYSTGQIVMLDGGRSL